MNQRDQLVEKFQCKFEAVSGQLHRVDRIDQVGDLLVKIFAEKGVKTISIFGSPMTEEAGLIQKFTEAGLITHTENLMKTTEFDHAGITEVNWGIAETGTMVQIAPEVDNRLCSTLLPIHVALLKTSSIVEELDEMLQIIHQHQPIPEFVGFITGPSRSSDIERTLAIGVHGPEQLILILVDQ